MIARPVRRASVTVCLAALAAACGGQAATSSAGSDPPTVSRAADTTQVQQASCATAGLHTVPGGQLRMPANAQVGRTPLLLVVIPGGDGDADDRLGIGRAGNRQGVALLYPTSAGSGFWQLNRAFGTSDVTDVTGLLQRQVATGCFDTNRISITGVSNGAGFTARMGCELPTTFAAVIPVAAGYKALDPCPGTARASFLDIHGTADTVVPINGREARPQGQRRPLHGDVGAARRLLREPEVEHAAGARHAVHLHRVRWRDARRARPPDRDRPRLAADEADRPAAEQQPVALRRDDRGPALHPRRAPAGVVSS